jgi:hypothetical protein
MQIIGFNFTKISGQKKSQIKRPTINTNIEITEISKDEVSLLKESEMLKISFKFGVEYTETREDKEKTSKKDKKSKEKNQSGTIDFEGVVLLAFAKGEIKDIPAIIKEKKLSANIQVPLYNFLLKKCATKALDLEENLDLPHHIPIPQVRFEPKEEGQ